MRQWAVGVDFGGTNIKVGLVDKQGRVASARRLASQELARPESFIEGIGQAIETLARSAGLAVRQLAGVGIGAPGPVDTRRGVVHSMVNVPGWRQVPLGRLLERRLACRCFVENDVNLHTLGEHAFGAGRGARHLICLTLGTGVGGGLLFQGELYRGASGTAGELGHMVIDPHGHRCGCGARGCLEAKVGTAAILRLAHRAIRRGAEPLRTLARRSDTPLSPALISEAARRGDNFSRAIWREVGRWLGVSLANLVNALNPDRIVIGGGVANAWRFFYPALIDQVRSQAFAVSVQAVKIVRAELGERAGIVGGAVLVWSQPRKRNNHEREFD